MNRDEYEATLNLLGWQPVRMATFGKVLLGVTRGLQFIHSRGADGYACVSDIFPGQTAIAEYFCVYADWQIKAFAESAMELEKQGEP